jgi:hypothetical protein
MKIQDEFPECIRTNTRMLAIKTKQLLLMINLGEDNNCVIEQNKDTRFGACFKWIQFSKCRY